jgi:hypothetical protein
MPFFLCLEPPVYFIKLQHEFSTNQEIRALPSYATRIGAIVGLGFQLSLEKYLWNSFHWQMM